MTAIEALKNELQRIQAAQAECLDKYNNVRPYMRYRYQILVQKAKEFKNSIDWLEGQPQRGVIDG